MRFAAIVVALAMMSAPAFAISATPSSDERTLRHLKEVLWPKAYAQQDVELLDSILATEFRLIDAEGNWFTKQDEIDYIKANAPAYDSLVFKVKRVDVFENGSAIVAGEGTLKGRDEEGRYVMTYQSTNVLIKREGKWRAVASHVSGVKRNDAKNQ